MDFNKEYKVKARTAIIESITGRWWSLEEGFIFRGSQVMKYGFNVGVNIYSVKNNRLILTLLFNDEDMKFLQKLLDNSEIIGKNLQELSVGKKVKILLKSNLDFVSRYKITGVIENLTFSQIYLNVNGCLEIYELKDIDIMQQI